MARLALPIDESYLIINPEVLSRGADRPLPPLAGGPLRAEADAPALPSSFLNEDTHIHRA
jgi:hypothetical protein